MMVQEHNDAAEPRDDKEEYVVQLTPAACNRNVDTGNMPARHRKDELPKATNYLPEPNQMATPVARQGSRREVYALRITTLPTD
jgi:hypothetical protein